MLRKGLAAAVIVGCSAVFASVALGANIICLAGSESCDGTGVDDTITGSIEGDNINAFGGNDDILPGPGGDVVKAGPGNDDVEEDIGADKVLGAAGADFVDETDDVTAANVINGGPGNDCIGGSEGGGDTIRGAAGNDRGGHDACGPGPFGLFGFEGNDRILGGAGKDGILGGPGADLLAGGKGKDFIDAKSDGGGQGSDTLRCGPGFDRYVANPNDVVANSCEKKVPPPEGPKARAARW